MTKIPFPTPPTSQPLFSVRNPSFLIFARLSSTAVRFPTMAAAEAKPTGGIDGRDDRAEIPDLLGYPTPLSPPYPALSKQVELVRAMSAASRSGLFALTDGDVVFEDEWLAVVNKPSGVYCENLLSSYSAYSLSSGNETAPPELHLANRLDRDTSGLMVITRSHKVAGKLVKAFTDHKVEKTYVALCVGGAPEWEAITLSSGHGRSKYGAWRVYSASDVGRTLPGGSVVKHMTTSFRVLSVNGLGSFRETAEFGTRGDAESLVAEVKAAERSGTGDEILIRAIPRNGRTHQIRLHCQYLGIPIRGDVKYGGIHEWKGVACESHALHAESLSFDHPVTGVPLRFRAPLPSWVTEASSVDFLENNARTSN